MEDELALLSWNHACSVGVRAMDDQHGILMDELNELHLAVMQGACRERISQRLDELIEFTRMHFRSEEKLMEQTGFPGLDEHCAVHQRLLAQVLQTAHQMQYGNSLNIRSVLTYLGDWFIEHIEELDAKYGAWLNARGIG
jgi:hemerythrin-like metal-binding protein